MQSLVERGCGLDVHQATIVACLLIVLKNGGRICLGRKKSTSARFLPDKRWASKKFTRGSGLSVSWSTI